MRILLFLIAFLSLALAPKPAEQKKSQWKVISNEDGVVTFRSLVQHKVSGITPLKAHIKMNFPLGVILSAMDDSSRKKDWVPEFTEGIIIEELTPYDRIECGRYAAPWPFDDREFLVRMKMEYFPQNQSATIDVHSVMHPKHPLSENYVRGHTYSGNVLLKSVDGGKHTLLEMTFLTDFKGYVPAWLINLIQTRWPYNMAMRLKGFLEKNNYKMLPKFKPEKLAKFYQYNLTNSAPKLPKEWSKIQ